MPNLNEFISKKPEDPSLQKVEESRPCASCDKDSEFYYWNEISMEMTWACPDNHKNSYRIN